jgi:hypothetical protein
MNAKIASGKNFIITPEGDTINLDNVAKVYVGLEVGVDDMMLYFLLGINAADLPVTSGSHAFVQYTYADNAAAVAAKALIDNALIGMGKVVDLR